MHSSSSAARCSTAELQEKKGDAEENEANSLPWTTLRCQKLLQKLESRLESLEKLLSTTNSRALGQSTRKRQALGDDTPMECKQPRITYGSRPQRTSVTRSVKGFSDQHRSFWSRGNGKIGHKSISTRTTNFPQDGPTSKVLHYPRELGTNDPVNLARELDTIRQTSTDGRYRIYRGIFDWLAEFLRTTEIRQNDVHRKSLMGMCLRRIPACLEEIEVWENSQFQGQKVEFPLGFPKASWEIYSQLEALGGHCAGWRPLTQTIRAHAFLLLRKAISKGLFEPSFVDILVCLCSNFDAYYEATLLVQAMSGAYPPPRDTLSRLDENSKLRPLHTLLTPVFLGEQRKGHGVTFDCVLKLLQTRRLPVSWVSTKAFSDLLTRAVGAIAKGTCSFSTTEFLIVGLETFCTGVRNPSLKKADSSRHEILARVAASLSAALIETTRTGHTRPPPEAHASRRRLLCVLDRSIDRLRRRVGKGWQGEALIILMARFLGNACDRPAAGLDSQHLEFSLQQMRQLATEPRPDLRRIYQLHVSLICMVSQGCGRLKGCPAYECFTEVRGEKAGFLWPDWCRQVFQGDSFTSTPTKGVFAALFINCHPPTQTREQETSVLPAWRWEEGIGEWVMRSPEVKYTSRDKVTAGALGRMMPRRAVSKTRRGATHIMDAGEAQDINPLGHDTSCVRARDWFNEEAKDEAEAKAATASLPQIEATQSGRSPSKLVNEGGGLNHGQTNMFQAYEPERKSGETMASCFDERARPQGYECNCSPRSHRTDTGLSDSSTQGYMYRPGTLLSARKAKRPGKLWTSNHRASLPVNNRERLSSSRGKQDGGGFADWPE